MALTIPVGPQVWRGEIARELRNHAATVELGVTAKEARKDPLDFLRYVLLDESGNPLYADHTTKLYVDVWEHCRLAHRHVSFVTPPGFGKTTLALGMLTRSVGQNPRIRSAVITADLEDTCNAVALSRQLVLTDHFREVYPDAKPDASRSMDARGWRRNAYYMQAAGHRKDPTMAAHAYEPKKESVRIDEGLVDDVITEANCDGQLLENAVRRFFVTWKDGRFAPRGWMCYQQNVRRRNDLAHRLRDDPSFCSVWIGVTADRQNMFCYVWNPPPRFPVALFPAKYKAQPMEPPTESPVPALAFLMPLPERAGWSAEDMQGKSASSFRQLYALKGVNSEDVMLKNWGRRMLFPGRAADMAGITTDEYGWPVMDHLARMRFAIGGGLDFSSTKRPGCAFWVTLKDANGEIYPLFLAKGRWTLGDINEIFRHLWANGVWIQRFAVETNGVQDMLLKSMVKDGDYMPWYSALSSFNTGSNKWNPEIGLPGVDVLFENNKIHWPAGEAKAATPFNGHWNEFELNAETMTRQDAKARPPDEIMAFWFSIDSLRDFGPQSTLTKPTSVKLRQAADPLLTNENSTTTTQRRDNPLHPEEPRKRKRDKTLDGF